MKTLMKNKLSKALSGVLLSTTLFSSNAFAIELVPTVEDAILNSPEFRQQIKMTQGVNADVKGAEGNWLPTVDLGAGIGKERTVTANTNETLTRSEASVRVTENLFEGFGTVNEIKRQEARLEAEKLNIEATANKVALDMVTAYINLLKEQDLLMLAEESNVTHERILDQIMQRTQGGLGNQVEVDQARARLALSKSNLAAARNNYQDMLTRFHRVLGRFPDSDLIRPQLAFQLPGSLEEAINVALMQHPTLRSANSDIEEARAQHAVAQKTFYPTVDLELQQTYDNNIGGDSGKNQNTQAMLRMRYNLYNGGKDTATAERTSAQIYEAAEIRNNTRRETIENLRYAWEARTFLNDQLNFQKQQIDLTFNTLKGYRQQFSLGSRTLLDLLNTENEYLQARSTMAQTEADYIISQFRILNGMGALVEGLGINIDYQALSQYSDK